MPQLHGSKKELEFELRRIFEKLMFGSREEYTEAKRQIEKLWHTSRRGFEDAP